MTQAPIDPSTLGSTARPSREALAPTPVAAPTPAAAPAPASAEAPAARGDERVEAVDRAVGLAAARPVVANTTSWKARVGSYIALTKPRIIELLLVTTLPAMILAAHGLPSWQRVLVTLIGGTLAAGSANALNCYVDRDIDAVMRRTGHRPLARHDVSPQSALVFGIVLGIVSVASMAVATNVLAAALTAGAIGFYVIVYTMLLKRRTSQNIVWGGAAGCMPVLIGWAAVTDSLSAAPFILFAVVFFWTPPHFWALAIRYREDYARAGVPMLPVVATPKRVAREIVIYSWLTVAASLALWPVATGWLYGALASAAGAALVIAAHRVYRRTVRGDDPRPMQLFHLSNSYLAFVFVAVAVDTFTR